MMLAMTAMSDWLSAQPKPSYVLGNVTDSAGRLLSGVSVSMLDRRSGVVTDDSGNYRLRVPSARAFALVFSAAGYRNEQRNLYIAAGMERRLDILLTRDASSLKEVVVNAPSDRRETGLIRITPSDARSLPSVTGGIEGLIKIFVGSNNELTSQYSVRGGNYDENLIYVNDFEIFRPYLVRSGQQEGLSFINPELTGRVDFYNGGFASIYGDKMSSVLDIKYRKPYRTGGTAYASLLEQGLHLEGISKNGRFTYLIGARNRTNRNLFASQETKGSYIPSSADPHPVRLCTGIRQAHLFGFFSVFFSEPRHGHLLRRGGAGSICDGYGGDIGDLSGPSIS